MRSGTAGSARAHRGGNSPRSRIVDQVRIGAPGKAPMAVLGDDTNIFGRRRVTSFSALSHEKRRDEQQPNNELLHVAAPESPSLNLTSRSPESTRGLQRQSRVCAS